MRYYFVNDNRFGGFVVPFLVGSLVGGAAVGATRPRPVIATSYPPVNMYPPMPVGPVVPYYPNGPFYY